MTATAGGLLRFGVGNDNVNSAAALPVAKFTHVAGVYDGGTLSVYVNGARVANKTTLVTAIPTNTLPLRLGADSAGATRFNGIIDETRLLQPRPHRRRAWRPLPRRRRRPLRAVA